MDGFKRPRCFRAGSAIAILVVGSTFTLPGCRAGHRSGPVEIIHDSPKALVASYQRAVLARQYAAILDAITPEERPRVEPVISAYKRFRESENRVTRAVAARFGTKLSKRFHKAVMLMMETRFTGALLGFSSPGVDVTSLPIEADGDGMAVLTPERDVLLKLRQVDGQWSVGLGDRLQYSKDMSNNLKAITEHIEYIARGIENGSIDERNVKAILSFSDSPPGMPHREVAPSRIIVE